MAFGVKTLDATEYHVDDLYTIADNHHVRLDLKHIDVSEVTVDMIKVTIMVYYDWQIPNKTKYFDALKELVKHIHFFQRFPGRRSNNIIKLIPFAKKIGQYFMKLEMHVH